MSDAVYNKEQIMEIIPHRDPFLLIDEINEIEPGKRVVTPGVLMIEMLAQAGAAAMLVLPENKGKLGLFAGIDKAKFKKQVVPGDTLKLEVEIIKVKGPIGVGKGIATVDGQKAVSAEITFAIK